MSTLRKLKRSGRGADKGFESIPLEPLLPVRKMSEVLLDFAEPLLGESDDDRHFRAAISIAAVSWNMAFLPPKEWKVALSEVSKDMPKGDAFTDPEIREVLHSLVDRKKALFADDNRIIINYQVVGEGARPRLLVASAPADDSKR